MKRILSMMLIAATLAFGQDGTPKIVQDALEDYNNSPDAETAADLISALIQASMSSKSESVLDLNEGRRLALDLLANRTDGASGGIGGGTSLTSLKSVTDLIAGAMESGAFSKNTQGSVATFRANVGGSYYLFTGDCPAGSIQLYPACVTEDPSPWRGLSVALSFDSSRSDQVSPTNAANPAGSTSALFLRARQGLSAMNFRWDFYKKRDPAKHKEFGDAVNALRPAAMAYATALGEGPEAITAQALIEGKPAALHALLSSKAVGERLKEAQTFVDAILAQPRPALPPNSRANYLNTRKAFLKKEVEVYQDLLNRKILSVEFTHQRPKDEPEYGGVRLIYSRYFGGTYTNESGATAHNWEATFNAAADFYYQSPAGQSGRSLRDFQAALQLDRRLWRWTFLRQPTFTLAGYYQRLTADMVLQFNSDALAPGTTIALPKPANVILQGTKGDVGIAQAKLSIPLGSAGVSVPLAISWSNRTEFLKTPGNDVRAQFGFLFDMDKLLAGLKK